MSPQEFIHKNITSELIRLGYDENAAMTGADMAVDHYRRCSQASRKGEYSTTAFISLSSGLESTSPNKNKPPNKRLFSYLTVLDECG